MKTFFLSSLVGLFVVGVILAIVSAVLAHRIKVQNPPQGRFLDLEGGRLHGIEAGAGAPVVLLHGASSNASDLFFALGNDLAKQARVLSLDRPGHGWSERIRGQDAAQLQVQSRILIEAINALATERVVIVAHSYAGAVALHMALDYPERIRGLVLLGPATHPWPGGTAWYNHVAASKPGAVLTRTLITPLGLLMMDKAIASVFAPQMPPPGYRAGAQIELAVLPQAFEATAQDLVALKDEVKDQSRRYGQLAVPVSIITGEADTTVSPLIHSRALEQASPKVTLTLLPGVGHLPHYANKKLVLEKIRKMLEL